MNRRSVLIASAVALVTWPFAARAQQPAKVPRIGFLGDSPQSAKRMAGFQRGLRELGYVEGQNITMEYRWTTGNNERLPALLSELIGLGVNVIVATNVHAALAAKGLAGSTPIIFVGGTDPVAIGLVPNLSRPGANVTAVASFGGDTAAKRLELAKEMFPKASRLAVLNSPGTTSVNQAKEAGKRLGIELRVLDAHGRDELEQVMQSVAKSGSSALVLLDSPFVYLHRAYIVELAAKSRLALIAGFEELADLGGVMTFDIDRADLLRQAASYVDKILRGAKAGDLPVYRPVKFELVVNLKSAKALGISVPQSLLLRADRVIE